jgi:thiamine-phosphate pyrophosphorylase
LAQLCLTIPALRPPAGVELVSAALAAAGFAAVLIVPHDGAALDAETALPVVTAIQNAGAAALLLSDAQLARVLKADGVHLPWSPDLLSMYEEARDILGRGAIVGVDAGTSRHDAMSLGELGADYIAFGLSALEPAAAERRFELVSWWAEIFEVPVVAFDVSTPGEAAQFAAAKADFVSIALPADPAAIASIAADFARAVGSPERVG